METLFLGCFLFGGLFSVVSMALGWVSSHGGHLGHGDLPHLRGGPADADTAHHPAHLDGADGAHAVARPLPLINMSSVLAFLTWFGAAGYLLLHFGGWTVLLALPVAVVTGGSGSLVIGLFLRKVMEGEQVLRSRDFELVGTMGTVTVTIPTGGVGEIVFTKAGARRSRAARGRDGVAVARGTEVVVTADERGIATVESWAEFVGRREGEREGQG